MRPNRRIRRFVAIFGLALWVGSVQPALALSNTQAKEADRFALGNAIWILYHEIGHLFVNEFQLPVLGREEDAVDHLATVTLLEEANQQIDGYLTDAVDGFFLSARLKQLNKSERQFYVGHGLDEQRAFEVACLMLGNDRKAFTELADSIKLPDDQRERCPEAYNLARSSWRTVLAPHTGSWLNRPKKTAVTFDYEAASAANRRAKTILQDGQVLEAAAEYLGQKYVFPRPVMLRARNCGDANAYFKPETGEVVLCYELVGEFRALLARYLDEF